MDNAQWIRRKSQRVAGRSKNELPDKIFQFATPLLLQT